MKKTLLSILAIAALSVIGNNAYSQLKSSIYQAPSAYAEDFVHHLGYDSPNLKSSAASSSGNIDTLWYSDFNDPSLWSIDNNGQSQAGFGWRIGSGTNNSWYTNTLIASASGGGYAEVNNGDPRAGTESQALNVVYTMTSAQPIDLTSLNGQNFITLKFAQFGARFNDLQEVQISTNGNTWTSVTNNNNIPRLTANGGSAYTNPTNVSVNLSSFLTSSDTQLWIRFRWTTDFPGSASNPNVWITYGWFIDDVLITNNPPYDVEFVQEFYSGRDSARTLFYNSIPQRQADAFEIDMVADVRNTGSKPAAGVKLAMNVTHNGNNVFSDTSAEATIPVNSFDSLAIPSTFTPNNGLGTYSINLAALLDSSANVFNNSKSVSFEVSNNLFRLDKGANTVYQPTDRSNWRMMIPYEFSASDTIIAIQAVFPSLPSSNPDNEILLAEGDVISYYLLADDASTVIASNEFYTVPAGTGTRTISLPIKTSSGGPALVNPGFYYLGVNLYGSKAGIAIDNRDADIIPISYILVTISGQNFYTLNIPQIRAITAEPNACQGVTINITESKTEFDTTFTGSIELNINGGTPPYSFTWSTTDGQIPSGQTNSQNLTGISTQGTYNVTVSDLFGCTETKAIEIGGTVSVKNLVKSSINVYPNPNTGAFIIDTKGLEGLYTVRIQNLLGKTVYDKNLNLSGNRIDVDLSEFGKGIYVLNVINTSDESVKAAKIVVK